MGFKRGFDKGNRRVEFNGAGADEPTGDLTEVLNAIQEAKQRREDRERRMRKNKKRNLTRGER